MSRRALSLPCPWFAGPWCGRRRAHRLVGIVLALSAAFCACLAWGSRCEANLAASRRSPAELQGPLTPSPTPLEVEEETLSLDCEEQAQGPVCRFEARYRVVNPTAQAESVVAAFYGVGVPSVGVWVDGERVDRPPAASERTVLAMRLAQADVAWAPIWDQTPGQQAQGVRAQAAFDLTVAAGRERDVVVRGVVVAGRFFRPESLMVPASRARHRVLGQAPVAKSYDVDYLLAPIRTWGAVGPITIRVRTPASWGFRGGVVDPGRDVQDPAGEAWVVSEEGPSHVRVLKVGAEAGARLYLSFTPAVGVFAHGGPLLAAGFDAGGGGLWLRAGWEVAAPSWLLASVSVGTDLGERWRLTPTLKVAAPEVYVVPSVSIGVGAPVRWSPAPRAGGRVLLDAHWRVLTLAVALDLFPGAPDPFDALLLGQVSF